MANLGRSLRRCASSPAIEAALSPAKTSTLMAALTSYSASRSHSEERCRWHHRCRLVSCLSEDAFIGYGLTPPSFWLGGFRVRGLVLTWPLQGNRRRAAVSSGIVGTE